MKRNVLAMFAAAGCSLALLAGCQTQPADSPVAAAQQIHAGVLPLVRHMDERFQSFQIGMSHLTGGETWRSYDSTNPPPASGAAGGLAAVREPRLPTDLADRRLRLLAGALGPFYVRYGGTTSNSVYFQNDDAPQLERAPEGYSVVLTRARWRAALEFAQAVDAKVVTGFTVSSGVRDASGRWTPRMAAPWLAYTQSVGGEIYAAELINEPNAPDAGHVPQGYGPAEFARDYAILDAFADSAAPNLRLAGPGLARLGVEAGGLHRQSAEDYMTATPQPVFDIVSYHFYGAVAERCSPPGAPTSISAADALTETWLARPDREFQAHRAVRDRFAPNAPIWITETGAAACGGERWQPTFLDTFRFLDTQARLAKQGLDAIFTHALISGSNGVIDERTFLPNANYWAALLWRRFIGTGVLDAGPIQPGLHIYAHCLRGASGGVTVLAINLASTPSLLRVDGPADVYALTAPELQSRTVLLNGQPLALGADDSLPDILPVHQRGPRISLEPTSVNFIALPQADNAACRI